MLVLFRSFYRGGKGFQVEKLFLKTNFNLKHILAYFRKRKDKGRVGEGEGEGIDRFFI